MKPHGEDAPADTVCKRGSELQRGASFDCFDGSYYKCFSCLVITLNIDCAGTWRSFQVSVPFEAEAQGNGRVFAIREWRPAGIQCVTNFVHRCQFFRLNAPADATATTANRQADMPDLFIPILPNEYHASIVGWSHRAQTQTTGASFKEGERVWRLNSRDRSDQKNSIVLG